MSITKTKTLSDAEVKVSTGVLVAFAVATLLPFFLHVQLVTGPIINAMLILVTVILGLRWALILSIVPSIMALAGGLLLPFLTPVVPFIIVSNMIMVYILNHYYQSDKNANNGYWKGVLAGSISKTIFLMTIGIFVLNFYHNPNAVKLAVTALGIVQLLTALIGSVLAFGFLKYLKRI